MSIPLLSQPCKKRKRDEVLTQCIICSEECNEDRSSFNLEAWENLRKTAFEWKGKKSKLYMHSVKAFSFYVFWRSVNCASLTREINYQFPPFVFSDFDLYSGDYGSVNWEAGPGGVYFHKLCKTNMQNKRKLAQAKRRLEKPSDLDPASISELSSQTEKKRLTRQSGSLHEKHLCIWCKN